MANQVTFQLIQSALPGQWHRTDGVLSMYIYAPVITGQKSPVEFNAPTGESSATSTWDYEVLHKHSECWVHFTNRNTQAVQMYRVDFLEKNKSLRLHSSDGYDVSFTG